MTKKINKIGIFLPLCIAVAGSSCSDNITYKAVSDTVGVPLEISIAGIAPTRSVITGDSLPNGSDIALFYKTDQLASIAHYWEGECSIEEPIVLDDASGSDAVYAVCPPVEIATEFYVRITNQVDYLRGISVDAEGNEMHPTMDNPRARLQFEHILARITLNIHKEASDERSYKFDPYLGGDADNSARVGIYDAKSNSFYSSTLQPDNYQDILGTLKDGKYWLNPGEDTTTADFLVLPTSTTWWVKLMGVSDSWWPFPAGDYKPGQQYIYDCLIKNDNGVSLTISDCSINPWINTDMPGVEGY